MGRGGGGVHHSGGGHHGGGGGGGVIIIGKANPVVSGVLFGILGVVFLILTIAVPVVLIADPAGDPCGPGESLNAYEQMVCIPPEDDLDETWIAEVESKGESHVKFYKTNKLSSLPTTVRNKYYPAYGMALSDEYADFSMVITDRIDFEIDLWCTAGKCSRVKAFYLSDEQFNNAFDDDGNFIEGAWTDYLGGQGLEGYTSSSNSRSFTGWAQLSKKGTSDVRHLVFSCKKDKTTYVYYNIDIDYTVYDVSGLKAEDCTGECEFEDMEKGEAIIMDNNYDCGTNWYEASIHNNDINWSAVIACAFIFGLLTIVCFALCFIYTYKILKKLGKIGKKAAKKIEKEQKKQAEANAAASAYAEPAPVVVAQPVADPNYGAQPYPGQPAYPGQM